MKVQNMTSSNGNKIANQFIIKKAVVSGKMGDVFQSYDTVIAFIPYVFCCGITSNRRFIRSTTYGGQIMLDTDKWDYSRTTGKYRNQFLSETKRETQKKIDSGEYILVNLN